MNRWSGFLAPGPNSAPGTPPVDCTMPRALRQLRPANETARRLHTHTQRKRAHKQANTRKTLATVQSTCAALAEGGGGSFHATTCT